MKNFVERIVVEKLYDNYNYDIRFDKGGVTLITGPNGYGKTTILKIIKNAVEMNFDFFLDLLFDKIEIFFDEEKGTKLVIERQLIKNDVLDNCYALEVSFYLKKSKNPTNIYHMTDVLRSLKGYRDFDGVTKESLAELFKNVFGGMDDKNVSFLSTNKDKDNAKVALSSYLKYVQDNNVLFVREQRILSTSSKKGDNDRFSVDGEVEYTIVKLANDLRRRYAKYKSQYTDQSQKIDSSFIKRLLKSKKKDVYDEQTYHDLIAKLNGLVDEYKKFGLFSNYEFVGDYSEKFGPALTLYMDDMLDKIEVYRDFYDQLSLFDRFVNGKGLSNKRMVLNEDKGISFVSDSGREVPLDRLSSGEQNLVILFYRLVFETKPNTLLLIDEPENSLHVEWLSSMLENYIEMEKQLDCQIMIATHSVPFIGGHWDIAFDLYAGTYQG